MTKARKPVTFDRAILRIVDRIGWESAAETVGKVEKVVRNWSDPDMDRAPSLAEAVRLDAAFLDAGGGEPPLMAVYQLLLDRARTPDPDMAALVAAVSASVKEGGEGHAAAMAALSPTAAPHLRAQAVAELDEAISAASRLRKLLAAPLLNAIDGGLA